MNEAIDYRRTTLGIGAVFACMFVVGLVSPLFPAQAEEPALPAEMLPAEMPPLPGSKERGGGLLIGPESSEKYRDLLVEPLLSWIRQRRFAFRAVRGLDHSWKLSESFETASARPETAWRLGEGGLPEKNPEAKDEGIALPFGNKTVLEEEKDPARKAKKILLNALFMENLATEFRYTFEMTWSGSQILRRRADLFMFQRFFPALDPNQPFFTQSLVKFVTPQPALNYAILSWIFGDKTRNRFWIYSPPIQRIREVLPANRSDGILGGTISTDDIFVWSGDTKRFWTKVNGEKLLFVFFPSTRPYSLSPQTTDISTNENLNSETPVNPASGKTQQLPNSALTSLVLSGLREKPTGGGSVAVLWNHDMKQFPQLPPWVPVSIVGVPRKVWEIELFPNDPFYDCGRELVYIDQELMLPVMKITYDRIGEFQKLILGGWGLAERKDKSVILPFFAFELAVEQGDLPVTALSTTGFQKFFGKETPGVKAFRAQFQPEAYGKPRDGKAEAEKSKSQANKSLPESSGTPPSDTEPDEDAPED